MIRRAFLVTVRRDAVIAAHAAGAVKGVTADSLTTPAFLLAGPHIDVCVWAQYREINASGALIFYDHEDRQNPLSFHDVATFARGEWRWFVPTTGTPPGSIPVLGVPSVDDVITRQQRKRQK